MRNLCAVLVALVAIACSKEEAKAPAKSEAPASAKAVETPVAPAAAPAPAPGEPAPAGEPQTLLDVPEGSALDGTQMNAASARIDPNDDDETRIYKQVRSRISQVNYCYAKQRKIEPRLAGKVTVKITVSPAPKGAVTTAEITEKSMKSPEVETCVLSTVKTFAFARKGKSEIDVHLPFVFR
jgi:TonB family protein